MGGRNQRRSRAAGNAGVMPASNFFVATRGPTICTYDKEQHQETGNERCCCQRMVRSEERRQDDAGHESKSP